MILKILGKSKKMFYQYRVQIAS